MKTNLILFFFIISISLAMAATYNDNNIYGNIPSSQGRITFNNNTGSTNSSSFWGSYLYSDYNMPLIKSFAYNQTEGYVPYVGAINNVSLGSNDLILGSSSQFQGRLKIWAEGETPSDAVDIYSNTIKQLTIFGDKLITPSVVPLSTDSYQLGSASNTWERLFVNAGITDGLGTTLYLPWWTDDQGGSDLWWLFNASLKIDHNLIATNINATGTTTTNILKATGNGLIWSDGTTGSTPAIGAGVRFMWIPNKKALRAGEVTGNQWNTGNIGEYSVAFGADSVASDLFATAFGSGQATGAYSLATGSSSASGPNTISLGTGSSSVGSASFSSGVFASSLGYRCFTSGFAVTADGDGSFCVGSNNNGDSTSMVAGNEYSYGSFVAGYTTEGNTMKAYGSGSVAMGQDVNALTNNNVLAFGRAFTVSTTDSFSVGFGKVDMQLTSSGLNITSNLTVDGMIKLKAITLPACGTATNGTIGRNSSGIYCCYGINWAKIGDC